MTVVCRMESLHTTPPMRGEDILNNLQGVCHVLDTITNNPGAAGGALTTEMVSWSLLGKELRNSQNGAWCDTQYRFRSLLQLFGHLPDNSITESR